MSQSIQEMVDVVERTGDHVYVLTKGHQLSNTDVLRLNRWLEAEGYVGEGATNLTILHRNRHKTFTSAALPVKFQPLLLCYLIIWPFISMIVAFLMFSK